MDRQYYFLKDITVLASCTALTSLNLSGCKTVYNGDFLSSCTRLMSLSLGHCGGLRDIAGLAFLTALISLDLFLCQKILNLDSLWVLKRLVSLNLAYVGAVDVHPLAGCMSLEDLNLGGMKRNLGLASSKHGQH